MASSQVLWEVQTDSGWAPFDAQVAQLFENELQQGKTSAKFSRGQWTYLVQFNALTQTNIKTRAVRQSKSNTRRWPQNSWLFL